MTAEKISVGELATTQLIALTPISTCSDLVATLKNSKHQAFPITAEVSQAYQSGLDLVITKLSWLQHYNVLSLHQRQFHGAEDDRT